MNEVGAGGATLLRERTPHGHARVTYVELFFDLVFVFAITQLSHGLAHHFDLTGAAQTLVLADSGLSDRAIGEVLHVHPRTIERTRQRAVTEGIDAALVERPRPGAAPLLDADGELALTVLACSTPPDGREHWTMQLLADAMVALEVVPAISDETVRRTLKKTISSPGRSSSGVCLT